MKGNVDYVNGKDFIGTKDLGIDCLVCKKPILGIFDHCKNCHKSKLFLNRDIELDSQDKEQDFLEAFGG